MKRFRQPSGSEHWILLLVLSLSATLGSLHGQAQRPRLVSVGEVVAMKAPAADARIAYGEDPLQFGYLRIPAGQGVHPVVIFIHGGCWLSQYDVEHVGTVSEALRESGFAVWAVEYRRVGDPGGGWPGTFLDIADGNDHLRKLAEDYPLDLSRVLIVGHSAGGHLALWAAARHRLPTTSQLYRPDPLVPKGVLALAAVPTLELAQEAGVCNSAIDTLVGGSPQDFPERYAQAAPAHLFPFGLPQILISGKYDESWFRFGKAYAELAQAAGEDIQFIVAPEAGHFEVILPASGSWPLVSGALDTLLRKP